MGWFLYLLIDGLTSSMWLDTEEDCQFNATIVVTSSVATGHEAMGICQRSFKV